MEKKATPRICIQSWIILAGKPSTHIAQLKASPTSRRNKIMMIWQKVK